MQNISLQNLQGSNVEGVSITNDLLIKEQRNSLNKYNQLLTDSQLLIRTNGFNINFELSDDEKEEITLDEEPLKEISTVGINFREHYLNDDTNKNNNQKNKLILLLLI